MPNSEVDSLSAFVLGAGYGNRLRPLTNGLPKPCVPVLGRMAVDHILDRLADIGFREVVINAHHLGDVLQAKLGARRPNGVRILYSVEPSLLGIGGGLRHAGKLLPGDRILIHNGDIVTNIDLRRLLALHAESRALATVAVSPRRAPRCVDVGPDGAIRGFRRGDHLFCGVYIIERRVIETLPPGSTSIMAAFEELLRENKRIAAFRCDESFWADIGSPAAYLECHKRLLEARGAGFAYGGNWIAPGQLAGAETALDNSAQLGGFACLGNKCKIGRGALIRDSVLWDGVTVADGCRVAGSIVTDNARIDRDTENEIVTPDQRAPLRSAAPPC